MGRVTALPPRLVTLALCLPGGELLGALPPFEVAVPWWQEVGPVVDAARERFGIDVTVLRLLHPPPLLAREGPRVLLAEAPGGDLYDAEGPMLLRIVSLLVGVQAAWSTAFQSCSVWGCPTGDPARSSHSPPRHWPAPPSSWTPGRCAPASGSSTALRPRFVAVAGCGVPDTLVHGDFHSGNLVGDAEHLVLLDWGDCGVGHPLLDRAAFLPRVPVAERADVRAHWDALWRLAAPGCDPTRAAELVEPVSALRPAVVYDSFVAAIEPSERATRRSGWPGQQT